MSKTFKDLPKFVKVLIRERDPAWVELQTEGWREIECTDIKVFADTPLKDLPEILRGDLDNSFDSYSYALADVVEKYIETGGK